MKVKFKFIVSTLILCFSLLQMQETIAQKTIEEIKKEQAQKQRRVEQEQKERIQREAERKKDSDGDGVIDAQDNCPFTPGEIHLNGCPPPTNYTKKNEIKNQKDSDGDWVIDSEDDCPYTPGEIHLNGCPPPTNYVKKNESKNQKDSDGDWVIDSEDDCPFTPGEIKLNGCPPAKKDAKKVVNSNTTKNTDYDQVFTKVDIPAEFPGGKNAWRSYIQRNLNPMIPINNHARAGQYTVIIKFLVDKEGNISNVTATTNHGFGMENEAIRVIKNGPPWTPGVQNGIKVRSWRTQPITFVVNSDSDVKFSEDKITY